MNAVSLLLLSFALAADAFALSVINGLGGAHPPNVGQRLICAGFFGAFQAGMPLLGYATGHGFAAFVAFMAHWIAFVLLCVLGVKMIVSASMQAKKRKAPQLLRFSFFGLLAQALATSLDAFSVGVGFAFLSVGILPAALCIGAVTFLCCLLGFDLGKRFGAMLADKAVFLGGLLLIAIGIYILLAHHHHSFFF